MNGGRQKRQQESGGCSDLSRSGRNAKRGLGRHCSSMHRGQGWNYCWLKLLRELGVGDFTIQLVFFSLSSYWDLGTNTHV